MQRHLNIKEMQSLRTGDRVKVVTEPDDYCDWVSDMDEFKGKVVTIAVVASDSTVRIYEDKGHWWWNRHCFEKIVVLRKNAEITANKNDIENLLFT